MMSRCHHRWDCGPWTTAAFIATLLLPLAACSVHKPIASHSTESNLAAETANNRMLLLNIVRASKYEPKYFTAVTMSRGQASSSLTPVLAIPFGVGWTREIFPTAGLSATANRGLSNVDVVFLDSHEFIRGLMQPVSTQLLAYFWAQGWDPEILFQLIFREIYVEGAGDVVRSQAKDRFVQFQEFNRTVRSYLDQGLTICEVDQRVGKPFEVKFTDANWTDGVLPALEAGFILKGLSKGENQQEPDGENKYVLVKKDPKFEFFWGDPDDRWRICLPENEAEREKDGVRVEKQELWTRRSTEGIIYFLGQIMRQMEVEEKKMLEGETWGEPRLVISREDEGESTIRLFLARPLDQTRSGKHEIKEPHLVSVTHEGKTYIIPDSPEHLNDRSMQALSLVTQLIGLQKHRADLPTTGVVTAIQ